MRIGRILALGGILLLAACHGDSTDAPLPSKPAPQKKAALPAKRGPSPEELTAGMVEAVPLGKSTLPMSVKFDVTDRPVVGQPLEVAIALIAQVSGSASVQVTSTEGLKIAPGFGPIDIAAVDPTQAYRVSIPTTPAADGIQQLTLNVSLTHDDTTEARSFSVPIIVGAAGDTVAVSKR
jgi:hypothetical protein